MANRAEWTQRIRRWQASGLTAREFAEREGLREQSLAWWKWKLGSAVSESAVSASTTFLPVRVVDISPVPVPAAEAFEVALPNGRVVRVPPSFDDATLERLLAIVAGGTG
jgi:transposase